MIFLPYTKWAGRLLPGAAAGAILLLAACTRIDIDKAETCLKLGDYPMAVRIFGEVLERDPQSYGARLGMGKALLQQAIDRAGDTVSWREACMHLEAARTLRPSAGLNGLLSQVWSQRAHILLAGADTIAALEALTRSIEYDPRRAEPLNAAGIIYFRLGEPEKARALFTQAAAADSLNPAVLFNLGMVAWHSGDIEKAHSCWLSGLTLSPEDQTMLYWFARAEKQMRRAESTVTPEK
jgi:tetratricopeptide (TPR) repeat protein